MTYPGLRLQVDVKVIPVVASPTQSCVTAIDEFTRLHFLASYPEQSTYSSADFLKSWSNGTPVEASAWSAFRPITALSSPTVSSLANRTGLLFLKLLSSNWHPPQAHPSLHTSPQRQGGAQPQGGPEAFLLLPQFLLPRRLR